MRGPSSAYRVVAAAIFSNVLLLSPSALADDPPASPPAAATAAPADPGDSTTSIQPTGPLPSSSLDLPTTETSSPVNRPLLVTSVLVLGGTYGASAIAGFMSSRPEDQHNLYYPVAGPWMDLANRDCASRPCNNEPLNKVLLIADGVGQGLAAIGVVSSFFLPEKTTRHWYLLGNSEVRWAPTSVGTGYGLAAVGRF
jgi:hypothetical protein